MPRLRNLKTGAVVSVSTDKAARLGSDWGPADKPAPKAAAKKAAPSSKSEK